MTTIQYRDAEPEDFTVIVDLFVSNMNLSVFTTATDDEALRQLATIFIAKDIHRATFMQVARCNDTLCGVIIGVAKNDTYRALAFDNKPLIAQAKETLRLSVQGRQVLSDLQVKDEISARRRDIDFDSELQFFCVDANYRRHRIGATLIQTFEDYLIAKGAAAYSLHTDSLCTYQYYDNNGYQRVDQYPSPLNLQIEHYTYVKKLS